jgi:hypothetical protein
VDLATNLDKKYDMPLRNQKIIDHISAEACLIDLSFTSVTIFEQLFLKIVPNLGL